MFQVAMVRLIARHYRRSRDDLDLGELRCRWKATRAAISRIAAAQADLAAADSEVADSVAAASPSAGAGGGCSRAATGLWSFAVLPLFCGPAPRAFWSAPAGGAPASTPPPPTQTARTARAPAADA